MNEICNGEVKDRFDCFLTLSDVLFFFTGVDHIPLFDFAKKFDLFFDNGIILPKISAYAHTATLPTKEIEASMKTALSFGGGFDDV